ncbi:MAG: ElyC/SanA/YdcF family protein [Patescibacteria group bacterium]|nr:ElyC/SanA/YdcF family protein [Patescibacteria group bacterium]
MRTGILVHGYHLDCSNWWEVVWGKPPHELGRLPAAVLTALRYGADLIICGTGASEKDGLKEGEYIRLILHDMFFALNKFDAFQGINLKTLFERVLPITISETESQNTAQEIANAGQLFQQAGIERVWLVSDPAHISRCHRDALALIDRDPDAFPPRRGLNTHASDIPHAGTAKDVAIVEPPHRPDQVGSNLNEVVNRILGLGQDRADFVKEIDHLLRQRGV